MHSLGELGEVDFACGVVGLERSQSPPSSTKIIVPHAQTNISRKGFAYGQNAKADKVDTDAGFKKLAFDRVNAKSKRGQVGFDRCSSLSKKSSIVREQCKVIDIAEIILGLKLLLNKVVKAVEIAISKELTGEVADRESVGAIDGSQQVIARKIGQDRFLGVTVVNDGID